MNKWYNNDKRKMLNLDSVNGYVFIPAKEYIEQNPTSEDIKDFEMYGDRIELIISGTPYIFRGETARELFDILSQQETQKELLKG